MENTREFAEFSVLMSVYAKEDPAHFRLALQSNLVHQTLLPTEMVLVCDGPLTPELDAVIAEYETAFPQVLRVCRLEKNCGLGNALNYGLQQCRYEWIARADSDDVCDKERFEIQMRYLRVHSEIDVLGGWIDEFESDWQQPFREKQMPLHHEEIVKMAKFRNPINHMTVIFRKSVIEAAGSYQHLPYMEDYFLWVRAICNGAKTANLAQNLVHARVGNGMAQRRGNRAQIASRKELNKYMVQYGLATKLDAAISTAYTIGFTYCPNWVRKFAYDKILRR